MTRYHRHKVQSKKHVNNHRILDKAILAAAIIEPLMTIPQAWDIFRDHTAIGVSLSTWIGYEALTVIWLWYGFVHKDKMVLIYQGLFMIIQTIVIIGAIMYGARW